MDDNSTTLMPTAYRKQLPKGFSHPVGAKALSNRLHDIPQWGEIELWFLKESASAHVSDHCSHHEQLNAELKSFQQVISVSNKHSYMTKYYSKPEWALYVHAIPSVDRHSAQQRLLEFGIAELRKWLKRPRSATELDSRVEFIIGYATDPGRLCFVDKIGIASAKVEICEGRSVVNEVENESLSK